MGALIAFKIDRRKPLGYVVKSILKGEVEEDARNVYTQSCHEAEVDGVYAFFDMGVGEVVERVVADAGEDKLGFGTYVE